MAFVVQCDMCGAICEQGSAVDIQANKLNTTAYKRETELFNRDVCEECLKKVKEVLKVD